MHRLLLLICFSLFSSCTLLHVSSDSDLTNEQVEKFSAEGKSTISGQVLLFIDEGKDILFGQNTEVLLVPVCEASTEIVTTVYGSAESGTHPMEEHPRFNWGDLNTINKLTRTDKRGSFTFRKLPAGSYYVLSFISIPEDREDKGASVMRRINVDAGKVKMVSLRL